jgi:cell division ATPase FtsA
MKVHDNIKDLEKAISESLKLIEETHGLIVADITVKTTGYSFEGTQRVVGVKFKLRV